MYELAEAAAPLSFPDPSPGLLVDASVRMSEKTDFAVDAASWKETQADRKLDVEREGTESGRRRSTDRCDDRDRRGESLVPWIPHPRVEVVPMRLRRIGGRAMSVGRGERMHITSFVAFLARPPHAV